MVSARSGRTSWGHGEEYTRPTGRPGDGDAVWIDYLGDSPYAEYTDDEAMRLDSIEHIRLLTASSVRERAAREEARPV
jgi:hypothetical protein